jgi:MFS transporter, FSR family, fosmidomycin resistance protein
VFQLGGNFGSALGPLLAALVVIRYGQHSVAWLSAMALISVGMLSYAASWYAQHLKPKGGGKRAVQARSLAAAQDMSSSRSWCCCA